MLVGGGHSHVQVLRRWAMRPAPATRITLIARELHTPYSGMLPGLIAGHYTYDDAHIDLGPLALAAGARLVHGALVALDAGRREVRLEGRPSFRYDVLSIDTGATPGFGGVRIAGPVVPVKPIGQFLSRWTEVQDAVRAATAAGRTSRILVVGGGVGGVELTLAIDHRLRRHALRFELGILCASATLLPSQAPRAQRRFDELLESRGVTLKRGFRVVSVDGSTLRDSAGTALEGDHVLWVTGVEAPRWPKVGGLATDPEGFIEVDPCLRSVSHPEVFATGDVAALRGQPRPKSGVYAVREGPVLAHNLSRQLAERRPRRYRAQPRALAIISEGARSATATRGRFVVWGRAVWRWKDWIDRRFMARFRVPASALATEPAAVPRSLPASAAERLPDPMRCGGCAAKLGSDVLFRVLRELPVTVHGELLAGIGEDAAVLRGSPQPVVVSVDALRAFTSDPYRFGRIAAEHAMSDVFAMGASPVAALALVTVPLMGEAQMEEDLRQVMHGAVQTLAARGVALAGGHSMEGLELALGFAVTGRLPGAPFRKSGLVVGDVLVITKPLGTGALLAGAMRGVVPSRLLEPLLEGMECSNAAAVAPLREAGVRACTDVTGFGLVGHLAEMLRASGVSCEFAAGAVPAYDGALEMLRQHVTSSLQSNNEQAFEQFALTGDPRDARVRLLADPQTSGGLLAGVPSSVAGLCVERLRANGYSQARIVGRIVPRGETLGRIDPGGLE